MSNLRKLPEDFPFAAVDADLLAYSYRPEACAYTCPLIRANALPRNLIQKSKEEKEKGQEKKKEKEKNLLFIIIIIIIDQCITLYPVCQVLARISFCLS